MNDQPNSDVNNAPVAEIPQPDVAQTAEDTERAGLLAALKDLREKNRALSEQWDSHQAEMAAKAKAEEDAQKTWEQRYTDLEAQHKELADWAEQRKAVETSRLEDLAKANADAISLLSAEQQANPALKDSDPEKVAAVLKWMAEIGTGGKKAVGGFKRPAAMGASGLTPEERAYAETDRMLKGLLDEGTLRPELVRQVMSARKR